MSSVIISGNTSGAITLDAPAVAGSNTLTLPAATGFVPVSSANYSGGIIPNTLLYRLNSAVVGSNVNTAQSALGVGVTLAGSTVYAFEGVYLLSKTAGTTSHTIGTGFGGTATLNNIGYVAHGSIWSTNPMQGGNDGTLNATSATATAITQAQSTATAFASLRIRGTVSVNAGGTFIPQYILSSAPGGAYTMAIGSYFMISPIGASGSNTSIGTWA